MPGDPLAEQLLRGASHARSLPNRSDRSCCACIEDVGGRTARRLLIVVVVLVALLAVADRVGEYVAERVAASTLQQSQHLASRPDVDVGGFPFLNQLATGHYDQITVTADDVPLDNANRALTVSRLRVVLHKLTVSRSFHSFHAQTATAAATISYSQLGSALGVELGYAGAGRLRATKQVTVAGTTVRGTVTSRPAFNGTALTFANSTISGAGQASAALADVLNRIFDVRLPLDQIPFDIHVTSLRASSAGVVLDLAGRDLSYQR